MRPIDKRPPSGANAVQKKLVPGVPEIVRRLKPKPPDSAGEFLPARRPKPVLKGGAAAPVPAKKDKATKAKGKHKAHV